MAQALRILLEAYLKKGELILVDRAEAIGNLEAGLSSVLNCFHSLHDSIQKKLPTHPVNWYQSPELLLVLAIRNARHHNCANKIRSLYSYHLQQTQNPHDKESYVLIDFPSSEEGGAFMDHYLSWADLNTFLTAPRSENRLNDKAATIINNYLHADRFADYASSNGLEIGKVFFNVIPLIANAAIKIIPSLAGQLSGLSTESKTFIWHFSTMPAIDTSKHVISVRDFNLP